MLDAGGIGGIGGGWLLDGRILLARALQVRFPEADQEVPSLHLFCCPMEQRYHGRSAQSRREQALRA